MFWHLGTGLIYFIDGEVVWHVFQIPNSLHEQTRE
ncbi:hypothetical protein F383_32922 [Gossypium arboreum]|uniref:Uncharacterized protein n=1 Tax=Gossypium arboreum TaxID=29729 RepID=A0A0B0MYL7_GOSAR|nr:hypothetical protein F383_32922 [Gossypium arboreum]